MTDNVVWLDDAEAATYGVPVEQVLAAAGEECEEVLVLGYLKGGADQLYAHASFGAHSAERSLWLMEQAKAWLLKGCPADEE